MLLVEVV